MCFSAQASFIASGVLGALGVATLRQASPRAVKPLAVIPCIFSLQQALEGVVWLTLQAKADTSLLHYAVVYGFVFFAAFFWPVWIPYALLAIERDPVRQKIFKAMIVNSLFLIVAYVIYWNFTPIYAEIGNHHIIYSIFSQVSPLHPFYSRYIINAWMMYSYFIATVGACFVSSASYAWGLGALIGVSYFISYGFYVKAASSVWCFFAAAISATIYGMVKRYVRDLRMQEQEL